MSLITKLICSRNPQLLLISALVLTLNGCASVNTSPTPNPQDPYESINRRIYHFNEGFDKYTLKPLAKGYRVAMPQVGKIMANNFFSNINDLQVTLNDFLQLKIAQGLSDGTRVIFNSTFGILGLINVTERLPKHDEDFGQTLGYWGIKPGPFVMLPFFGPRNIRDSVGLSVDSYTDVVTNIPQVPLRNTLYVSNKVRVREQLFDEEDVLNEVQDPYVFIRDAYLKNRENLVYDGNPPQEKYQDEED